MSDMYKAPQAELTNGEEHGDFGSVEKGIAGDYSFSISETVSEGWRLSKGKKRTVWLGILLYVIALIAITVVAGFITGVFTAEGDASFTQELIYNLITTIIGFPLAAGMTMIGIKIARGEDTSGTEVLAYFDKIVPLVIVNFLMAIFIFIGLLLLVLPGIYLMVAYLFAIPLVVDQNLGPWQALEASRKAVTKRWFSFLGFLILLLLIGLAGFLAVLIGMIWALPLLFIAIGVAYRKVFGSPHRA
ncbi:hypothetical protein [Microbulbifer spongiae]|uniref:DUF975 family protein n=1 Tax=Microbulbifer spongiae TaxID=2944933 RepID=A0ABY9EDY6_9GAMM|nr:hypothetical protein [Microbulbifer sp. MI-G]WKD50238.1 hypothetical protein M8T91_02055 [Microbulbifer sp. MI-G]